MINTVPDGWKLGRFGDLAKVQNGYAFKSADFSETGYAAAIRMSNLKLGRIDLSDARYASESIVGGLDQFRLAEGDFLFGMSGSLDNYAWVRKQDGRCYLNQRVGCLKAKANADSLFASYCYLSETVKREIVGLAAGAAQLNISSSQLEAISIPIPPLPEQQKIATILSSVDNVIETTRAQIGKLKDLKAGMMQALLTKGIGSGGVPHTEFKDSPLGRIPLGWNCLPLESLLESNKYPLRSGPFGSSLLKQDLVPEGVPYLGIDNVHVEHFKSDYKRFISDDKFNKFQRYQVFPGDVMITIMGTVGRTCVVPINIGKVISSKHVWTMTFNQNKYVPELACWQLNFAPWVKKHFMDNTQGGVMDSISSTTIKSTFLPVPPMEEQIEIAATYKSIMNRVSKTNAKLNALETFKKALMQDLLTGKVRVNIEQKEKEPAVA
jgi:type I restriction enzyme S subunit